MRFAAILLAAALAWPLGAVPARADDALLVTPTRVVFEGRERSAAIAVINKGRTPATYRISLERRRMNETGDFEAVRTPQPGERFADALVRFSPRQVTLPPGGSQMVRVRLMAPADLPVGEYRSHMLFRAVPTADAGLDVEALAAERSGDFKVRLAPVYGVSIPLIVRKGQLGADIQLAGLQLSRAGAGQALSLELKRDGARSVCGDFSVAFVGPDGKGQPVGAARRVAVYTPNRTRKLLIPVTLPGKPPNGARLRVTFQEAEQQPGRVEATADLPLN